MLIAKISNQKDKLSARNIFSGRKLWKKVFPQTSFLVEIYVRDKLIALGYLHNEKKCVIRCISNARETHRAAIFENLKRKVLARSKVLCYKVIIDGEDNNPCHGKTDSTGTS